MDEQLHDIIAFLREYSLLCTKYQMVVSGCGCCGSPFLAVTEVARTYAHFDDELSVEGNVLELVSSLKGSHEVVRETLGIK